MPEGPEIRRLVEILKDEIKGKIITDITSNSKYQPKLPNKGKVLEIGSKGKLLWLRTSKYYIHLHMMLTGWIFFDEPDYTKYIIHFGKKNMYIDSQRKFTKLNIRSYDQHDKIIDKLGIDVLTKEFTYDAFYDVITKRKMSISKFLLDQDKLCGTGNYVKSESLYIARINPKSKTHQIDNKSIKRLYNAIKYIVYSKLITWLKDDNMTIPNDIKKLQPKKITYPYKFKVYNKEKDPKGNKITVIDLNGRATFYVPKLQKN
jgi:formamidopyrimidine-DNA glycosylase